MVNYWTCLAASRAVVYTLHSYTYSALYYNQLATTVSLDIPYPIIQHFYFAGMIGIAPLPPRDDDKALLLSPEEQKERLI